MKTVMAVVAALALCGTLSMFLADAVAEGQEDNEKKESAEAGKDASALAAALGGAKLSLAQGLAAGEREGRPISAKYEIEDGALQLSVYTMKGDKFYEVIVDYTSGKVLKSTPITEGDDLSAARSQAAAMSKAKRGLQEVVAGQEKGGDRVISVAAEMEDGRAQADIVLLHGRQAKHVETKLD